MQVICTLALHHPLTAVSHEVTLRYVEQMQHSSLSCFAVGHTSSSVAPTEQDTFVHDTGVSQDDYGSTAIDVITDCMSIQWGMPVTEFFTTDKVTVPNEKVGCIFVTIHSQQYLEEYLPSSDKQAFLDIYHILSLLDRYLYDNPKQHTYCMSLDNEYVALLKYAISLHIDISMFPTVWDVLSILLDTQDSNLEYVKFLQKECNRYYEHRTRKYM